MYQMSWMNEVLDGLEGVQPNSSQNLAQRTQVLPGRDVSGGDVGVGDLWSSYDMLYPHAISRWVCLKHNYRGDEATSAPFCPLPHHLPFPLPHMSITEWQPHTASTKTAHNFWDIYLGCFWKTVKLRASKKEKIRAKISGNMRKKLNKQCWCVCLLVQAS